MTFMEPQLRFSEKIYLYLIEHPIIYLIAVPVVVFLILAARSGWFSKNDEDDEPTDDDVTKFPAPAGSIAQTDAQRLAMASVAMYTELDDALQWYDQHGANSPTAFARTFFNAWTYGDPAVLRQRLAEWWNIHSRQEVAEGIQRGQALLTSGSTNPAWDAARHVHMLRLALGAGFIGVNTFWEQATWLSKQGTRPYRTWEAYGNAFAAGRNDWSGQPNSQEARDFAAALVRLTSHAESPWRRVDITSGAQLP